MDTLLIVPGLGNSGPEHWQTWLQDLHPHAVRVSQDNWNVPDIQRWSSRTREVLDVTSGRVWLVAHSFGCLASVHALADRASRVSGALLVAPADPNRVGVEAALPTRRLPFPSFLVASTTDPWLKLETAKLWASRWGSRLSDLGAAGHINVDSGFGPWPVGLALLHQLQEHCEPATTPRSAYPRSPPRDSLAGDFEWDSTRP
jgi:uncharacterized protein